MNYYELTFYRLYPHAIRITTNDALAGRYEYLVKDDNDANELLAHLKSTGIQGVDIERLYKELPASLKNEA